MPIHDDFKHRGKNDDTYIILISSYLIARRAYAADLQMPRLK